VARALVVRNDREGFSARETGDGTFPWDSSDVAYPTVGFFPVADELEVNQALMAVNGIDEAVIAAEADGEAVCPPLKLLALVRRDKTPRMAWTAFCRNWGRRASRSFSKELA
jgi:hypothetical protein